MKKFLSIFVAVVALMMVSCGGSQTPSDAAVKTYDYVIAGDYKAAVDTFYFEDVDPEEEAQARAMLTSMFEEKVPAQFEKKGGLNSVEAISETIAEDGENAVVELKITYGDGSEEVEELDMHLDAADGKWKPVVKK